MFNISQYLEKIKKVGADSFLVKEEIIKVLKEKINLTIGRGDVKIEKGIIIINCRPVYKNAIFIAKINILEEIDKRTGKSFFDIR